MEPGEALGVAAQVAATLAGFAGVVVVFRPASVHQWSRLDKLRLQLLLSNSILPLAYSLLGILLLAVKPPPESIWRWCSGFALLFLLPGALMGFGMMRKVYRGEFFGITRLIFFPLFVMGAFAVALQIWNAGWVGLFWPFFVAICVHLLAAMLQFVRLVLLQPEQ